jgi:hypothetical protein
MAKKIASVVGTARKMNRERQPKNWSIGPATIGPAVAPIATAVVSMPRPLPRSLLGNTAVMIAMTTDWPIAPPIAITTLAAISTPRDGAAAAISAPTTKNTMPVMWNFFRPAMSATRPSGSMIALTVNELAMATHVTARRVTLNSSAMVESARNVMEKSITMTNSASATVQNAFHL